MSPQAVKINRTLLSWTFMVFCHVFEDMHSDSVCLYQCRPQHKLGFLEPSKGVPKQCHVIPKNKPRRHDTSVPGNGWKIILPGFLRLWGTQLADLWHIFRTPLTSVFLDIKPWTWACPRRFLMFLPCQNQRRFLDVWLDVDGHHSRHERAEFPCQKKHGFLLVWIEALRWVGVPLLGSDDRFNKKTNRFMLF